MEVNQKYLLHSKIKRGTYSSSYCTLLTRYLFAKVSNVVTRSVYSPVLLVCVFAYGYAISAYYGVATPSTVPV